ncbi:hypothetical protein PsorP6_002316 [Peronosclerospora sorghi]|uniref:Uncharacterized protein n=1 Tax=Peronosclerospora sorghi TaxID=230839 RepID=A0ACC0WWL6_9STRA|nr:hypothetical protein PsorP6_002316 [Peronosclerospora sorghi]
MLFIHFAASKLVKNFAYIIFSDPRASHFHSFKQFFLSYMPPAQPFDISGLANAIVGQVSAGIMVCVEGQDDVYGFVTAQNLKRFEKKNEHPTGCAVRGQEVSEC